MKKIFSFFIVLFTNISFLQAEQNAFSSEFLAARQKVFCVLGGVIGLVAALAFWGLIKIRGGAK